MNNERENVISEAKQLVRGLAQLNATFLGSDLTGGTATPLERKFAMIYDYATNGEWDELGQLFLAGDVIAECISALDIAAIANANGLIHFGMGEFFNCKKAAFRANARIKLDDEHSRLDFDLSISEFADASGLSESYLRNAAADKGPGRLPTIKHQGHVYIDSREALCWLRARGRVIKSTMTDSVLESGPCVITEYLELDKLLRVKASERGLPQDAIDHLGLTLESPACLQLNIDEWAKLAKELAVEPLWLAGVIFGIKSDSVEPRELERWRAIVFELAAEYRERVYGHMVLVPVAADGTYFHPGLKRRRGFQIGPKGDEAYVNTYKDALERLKSMAPKPYWRRPNENGIPGIVAGVAWKEVSQKELDGLTIQAKS